MSDAATFYAWRLAAAALPTLPETFDRALAEAAGTVAYATNRHARAAVRANLAVIAPRAAAAERERMARRVFVTQVRNYLTTFRLPRLSSDDLRRRVRVEGWEHVAAANGAGRGLIIASAHLGPLALVGQVVAARGVPVHVIAEAIAPRLFDLLNRRLRGAFGTTFVPATAARTMVRILRGGGAIGVLGDRAVTGVGMRVPFFGREALLPAGHVLLAMRTGAPLLPGFAIGGDAPRAELLAPLELEEGRGDEVTRRNVARWAAVLERYVGAEPTQWAVFDPVWERS